MPVSPCVALVLAGGRSSRLDSHLGGLPKALAPLAGLVMLDHVLAALRPQVTQILLGVGSERHQDLGQTAVDHRATDKQAATEITASKFAASKFAASQHAAKFTRFGLPLLADHPPSACGPLAGLHAGLEWLAGFSQSGSGQANWLLLCPCDAPFLPADLAGRLLQAADQRRVPVACAASGSIAQPTFSAWHVSTLPAVEVALAKADGAGLMRVLDSLPHTLVQWADDVPPPFYNVNTAAELAQAESWMHGRIV